MKTYKLLFTIGTAAALTFITGCDNKPNTNTNTPDAPKADAKPAATAVSDAVEAAKPAVDKAVTDAKAAATTAVADTKAAASAATADVTAKFNSVVDQAKSLLGQNKYTEALNSLQSLSGLKLTPEQEKIVTDLKAQIQKLMAAKATTDGANAVGNLLQK